MNILKILAPEPKDLGMEIMPIEEIAKEMVLDESFHDESLDDFAEIVSLIYDCNEELSINFKWSDSLSIEYLHYLMLKPFTLKKSHICRS